MPKRRFSGTISAHEVVDFCRRVVSAYPNVAPEAYPNQDDGSNNAGYKLHLGPFFDEFAGRTKVSESGLYTVSALAKMTFEGDYKYNLSPLPQDLQFVGLSVRGAQIAVIGGLDITLDGSPAHDPQAKLFISPDPSSRTDEYHFSMSCDPTQSTDTTD